MSKPDYNSSANQRILSQLVDREVYLNVSYLISEVAKVMYDLPSGYRGEFDPDEMSRMLSVPQSHEETAFGRGYRVTEHDGRYYWYEMDGCPMEPFSGVPDGYRVEKDPESEDWYWEKVDDPQDPDDRELHDSKFDAITDLWENELDHLYTGDFDTEEEAWEDCVETNDLEVESDDVYEHWAVTNFFARKLQLVGETVVDFCNLNIWCRTCTGQAIHLDSCIGEIGYRMEILQGQRYDWGKDDPT